MRLKQHSFQAGRLDMAALSPLADIAPNLVLVFGSVAHFTSAGFAQELAKVFPVAALVGCTTAGEITNDGVRDNGCVVTAIHFEHTRVAVAEAPVAALEGSHAAGEALGRKLAGPGLAGVLMFGKGVGINGSALIEGLVAHVGGAVPISGGLAGDGGAFKQTFVLSPAGISDAQVVAVGLYGERLRFGHGSFGGWEPFGPNRKITRSTGNILYELDGEPALNVYKLYLGEYAKDLPASGLLFPFEMLDHNNGATGLIRTILGVDESDGSLVLAGAIEEGGSLRLMHASTDALIDGAENAARGGMERLGGGGGGPGLGLLVSCVGRKLVMGDQVDEEVEAVAEHLGREFLLTGFYSYGEISPMQGGLDCRLHNQTMTVAVLAEA